MNLFKFLERNNSMWYVIITILIYSLILTIVTIYKDNSGYYEIGVADIIVAGPICWIMLLVLFIIKPIIKPLMKNHKSKSYSPKSEKYIKCVVSKIIKNYKKHRNYTEYFDFSFRQGQFNVNDVEGWGRLIINRSYYGGLTKKYERLMFNQKEDVLPILLAYFNAFTKDDINNDTPYEVKQSLYNNKLIYVLPY